ncbi:MAG TPA: S8 family serine peptidase, partial [Gemmatimonadaceae bacterium]|nr:S8 family serine peptidase [Gemmatimonadaceae bacterium]
METLLFQGAASRRFTQDSPVLPDVWLRFAELLSADRNVRADLLLTPHRDSSAPDLCKELRRRLAVERESTHWAAWHGTGDDRETRMAYHQSSVVARLSLDELIRVVLPLSAWWRDVVPGPEDDLAAFLRLPATGLRVLDELAEGAADPEQSREMRVPRSRRPATTTREPPISPDLLWMIRITGTVLLATGIVGDVEPPRTEREFLAISRRFTAVLAAFETLIDGAAPPAGQTAYLYTVALNRQVTPSIARSVMAVKGDAARRVFDVDTRNIGWAILDSGIDAEHQAFRKKDPKTSAPFPNAFDPLPGGRGVKNNTTVVATFDFANIRVLLNPDVGEEDRRLHAAAGAKPAGAAPANPPAALTQASAHAPDPVIVAQRAAELTRRLNDGRAIDWDELAPLLTVPYGADYIEPEIDHGTHVAGILGGNWTRKDWGAKYPPDERDDLVGVCPGLALYDFRVLGEDGYGDEFTVMAALQFIRHLNSHRDQQAIHGANLSLSLKHDVANYACGRTPVC